MSEIGGSSSELRWASFLVGRARQFAQNLISLRMKCIEIHANGKLPERVGRKAMGAKAAMPCQPGCRCFNFAFK